MPNIAIFAALQWECGPILRHLGKARRGKIDDSTVWRGRFGDVGITLIKTGMGLARAEAAARRLVSQGHFALFLSSGCAGALAPQLGPGDLVVAESIGLSGGAALPAHPEHRERAIAAARRAGLHPHLGHFLSSPTVLATRAEKHGAAQAGAIAVEMEGAAIARVAAESGVAFAAVRSILDTADIELEMSGHFVDPATGSVRPIALAGHLLRHPTALPHMLSVKRMMDAADTALARFFAAYLDASGQRLV